MNKTLEFTSTAFPAYPGEEESINPGRYGKRLAEFLRDSLPAHGFRVKDMWAEDWGWNVEIENPVFALWIGCGRNDEDDENFICFTEPSKPYVWRWFRRIATTPTVEKLEAALLTVITESGKATNIHWQAAD